MRSILLICLLGVGAASTAHAQSLDTFMHIDGIVGDAQAAGHVNDILLTGYSQTFAAKTCSRVVATKFIDRSSPALISRAANNLFIPTVVICRSQEQRAGRRFLQGRPRIGAGRTGRRRW